MSLFDEVYNYLFNAEEYLNKTTLILQLFDTRFGSDLKEYLKSKEVVVVKKQFHLSNNDPIDFLPNITDDDTSFPLDLLFKEQLERAFGKDLSMVRIHTGEYAHQIASKHSAKAVTMGNSIFFSRGMYNPYTEEGLALLAHEIEHVVQHNDKDISLLFDEDIAMAEYMAEVVEDQVKSIKLHNVNNSVLNNNNDIERVNSDDIETDSFGESNSNLSLSDFSSKPTDVRYNITTKDGKVYNISKKERAQVIELTISKVKEHIVNHLSQLSDVEKDNYLIKVMNYVKGSVYG